MPSTVNPALQLGMQLCPLFRGVGQFPIAPFVGGVGTHVLQQEDWVMPFDASQHDSVALPLQHSAQLLSRSHSGGPPALHESNGRSHVAACRTPARHVVLPEAR